SRKRVARTPNLPLTDPVAANNEAAAFNRRERDGTCSEKKASVLLGVMPRLRVCLTASLLSPLLVGIGTAVGAADSAIPYHDVAFVSQGVICTAPCLSRLNHLHSRRPSGWMGRAGRRAT